VIDEMTELQQSLARHRAQKARWGEWEAEWGKDGVFYTAPDGLTLTGEEVAILAKIGPCPEARELIEKAWERQAQSQSG
jgi:hypothetical protein